MQNMANGDDLGRIVRYEAGGKIGIG